MVCDKTACFYICDTQEQLNEHRLIKHIKKEAETTPQRFVCDLCGQVWKHPVGVYFIFITDKFSYSFSHFGHPYGIIKHFERYKYQTIIYIKKIIKR